ncbi:hypothetical protein CO230_05675 [Chryseobacterium sp. 6424]|uniref:hypothetical protein n=1 Tax=Chryseobacterium sp. 6424 TaxID=2039166 RepID=UPI000EFD84F8|nr:hypothetical protein [Chryseobacterium sp. 6424]AYO57655.1 hypothetical protein CO230_05675 [Chryseobacterium sp. 6424]
MSYTVVGMFPTTEEADRASAKLDSAGFGKQDYQISRYSTTGEYTEGSEYDEDEKTSGFWDWLFGDNDNDRKKYSYAGTKSNIITVYTNTADRAEKARDIMNDAGAINVNDFTRDRYAGEEYVSPDNNLTEDERARIITKAKNDLYLTSENRTYNYRNRGMMNDMDSAGNKDDL